jgi:hypothetical protein
MKVKGIIIFAIIGLAATWLAAQNTYMREIPLQIPPYLHNQVYTPKQIYPCPDGGVIILGNCEARFYTNPEDPPGISVDCGAIKMDAEGNCEWQWWSNDFGYLELPLIIGIDQEPNGRVNFLINIPSQNTASKIGWIEPDGTYSLQNAGINPWQINRAMRLSNGDIFAIGYIDYLGSTHRFDAYFVHYNPQGDTLSTKRYPPDTLWISPGAYYAEAFDMEFDTDGMPVSTCLFTNRFASVVKTDWDGNIIWRRDTNNQVASTLYDFAITKMPQTNELYMGYRTYSNGFGNQYEIHSINDTDLDSLFSIQTSDGWVSSSYYSMVGNNQNIYVSGYFEHNVHIGSFICFFANSSSLLRFIAES